jgi:capsular polysaccharide biosynthesis protein
MAVFLLVFITAALITFILPESFLAIARAQLPPAAGSTLSSNQFAAVVEASGLNDTWGRRYADGGPLHTEESVRLLQRRAIISKLGNTELVEVKAFSEQPAEAANLANALAEELVRGGGQVIDRAVPPRMPARPNKPLNLTMGAIAGLVAAAVVVLLARFATTRFGLRYSS